MLSGAAQHAPTPTWQSAVEVEEEEVVVTVDDVVLDVDAVVDDVVLVVVDVDELELVVVVVGQFAGVEASFARNVLSSLPSLTTAPPNSVQYCCVFSVVTTATGAMLPFRSIATWLPPQTAFTSTPSFTRTTLHVAPLTSRYL
jgi:hypothetical protein